MKRKWRAYILCILSLLSLVGCVGKSGHTPVITIGSNGNWYVDGVDTGVKAQGESGKDGNDGQNGIDGTNGSNGTNGINGQDGKSAYDIWLEAGHEGSEEDFLNWLKGTDGKDGEDAQLCIHNWEYIYTLKESTCIEQGNALYYCTLCNLTKVDDKELKGHTYIDEIISPTCIEQGYTKHTCSECGYIEKDNYVEAIGGTHNFINGTCTKCNIVVSESVGLEYSLNSDGNSYSVIGVKSNIEDVVFIPSTYNGLPVTAIGNNAFDGCTNIKEMYLANGINSIGNRAFYGCTGLKEFIIPSTVINYGSQIFTNTNIKTIYCNSNNGGSEDNQIFNVASLTKIVFGGTSINSYACYGCSNLIDIEIKETITSIKDNAFYACNNIKNIIIPSSVTSVGNDAFYGCSNLMSIEIPSSVTILHKAFEGCTLAKIYCEVNQKPSGWDSDWNPDNRPTYWDINENNHYIADNGVIYVIKDGLAKLTGYIGNETTIIIPSSITFNGNTYTVSAIGERAFRGCALLETIFIPSSVVTIETYGFYGCPLLSIYCEFNEKPSGWDNRFNRDASSNGPRPVYWYSENEPTEEGNYWHYVDGIITKW